MWGLISLEYLQAELPEQSFLYLWDTLYLPYGDKSPEFIAERTFACLEWMFGKWCELVILACNTASAYSIRSRQDMYPKRKVLSVTVPGVEAIIAWWYNQPLVLSTLATAEWDIYPKLLHRIDPTYACTMIHVVWNMLVDMIEWSSTEWEILIQLKELIWDKIWYDCLVLWCTHYPLIVDLISKIIPNNVKIINPAWESAYKLKEYLRHHPEIVIPHTADTTYYVTWSKTDYAGITAVQAHIVNKSEIVQ